MTPIKFWVGIDPGATKSAMAWYDPETNQVKPILNREGEETTLSLVYYTPDNKTLVGTPAQRKLEEPPGDQKGFFTNIKGDLIAGRTWTIDGQEYTAEHMLTSILKKLKEDAEDFFKKRDAEDFQITHAVITYPVRYTYEQMEIIENAAKQANFREVQLLTEPSAAATAALKLGSNQLGQHFLIYDFGGGTFDVSVLRQKKDSEFDILADGGLLDCGGENLDAEVYEYFKSIASTDPKLKESILRTGKRDLRFLYQCRLLKESLSRPDTERAPIDTYLTTLDGEVEHFKSTLERTVFEELISKHVKRTIEETQRVIDKVRENEGRINTVLMIGGSSRIPLVRHMLEDALPQATILLWRDCDLAIAKGAAFYAQDKWRISPAPAPPIPTTPTPAPPPPAPRSTRWQWIITMIGVLISVGGNIFLVEGLSSFPLHHQHSLLSILFMFDHNQYQMDVYDVFFGLLVVITISTVAIAPPRMRWALIFATFVIDLFFGIGIQGWFVSAGSIVFIALIVALIVALLSLKMQRLGSYASMGISAQVVLLGLVLISVIRWVWASEISVTIEAILVYTGIYVSINVVLFPFLLGIYKAVTKH